MSQQSDAEITGCISDIGFPFTIADLHKPNPVQIQQIFECLGELLMNATRETVEPVMRAAAEDVCGEFMDIIPTETRNLMGFYVCLRKVMMVCGITDFSFQDLQKPTYERLSKILSYLINFVRFRESLTDIMDEHIKKAESTKIRVEQLDMENQEMEGRLEELQRNRITKKSYAAEKIKRNEELKTCLRELERRAHKLNTGLEEVRKKKEELMNDLQDKVAQNISMRQESEKLRSHGTLKASLADLNNALNADKSLQDSLDRRARALQTSTDTFTIVSGEVSSCIKVLQEVSAELAKEDEENAKATRQRDALRERSGNVQAVEREEGLLKRQIAKYNERTEKLRAGSRDKARAAKERMEELRAVHRKLTEERAEKSREMEKRRVRIEQTEKKVCDSFYSKILFSFIGA